MAKTCMIARETRRRKLSQQAKAKRGALREITKSQTVSFEDKMTAVNKLSKSPRDESMIRVRSRCRVCGRPRSIYRKFGLCRIHLREAFVRGDVPGMVKASW